MTDNRLPEPSRRDRLKPVELLLLCGGIGLFAGLVTLMSTRDVVLTLIVFGIVFIVALVTIALLILAMKPTDEEQQDLRDQDLGH